jgi:hypothetical protein
MESIHGYFQLILSKEIRMLILLFFELFRLSILKVQAQVAIFSLVVLFIAVFTINKIHDNLIN